jgi:hypothetical protein
MEAGALRALAISSAERLPGVDAKTLREQGLDLEFENWRSVMAPPGLTGEQKRALSDAVAAMVRSSEWTETLERFRWLDRYLPGEDFARFAAAEEARVRDILARLGTGDDAASSLGSAGPYPLFVLGGVLLFGLLAMLGAARGRGSLGGSAALRGSAAPAPLEPAPGARHQGRALALIAVGAIADLLLVERAGFLIASAVLFWLVARAFDERRPLRDAACAIGVSVVAYVLFAKVLELPLPAGVLAGWL